MDSILDRFEDDLIVLNLPGTVNRTHLHTVRAALTTALDAFENAVEDAPVPSIIVPASYLDGVTIPTNSAENYVHQLGYELGGGATGNVAWNLAYDITALTGVTVTVEGLLTVTYATSAGDILVRALVEGSDPAVEYTETITLVDAIGYVVAGARWRVLGQRSSRYRLPTALTSRGRWR